MIVFHLKGHPYIELNKLLKFHNLVASGGEAKYRIREWGEATVNGEVERQVQKKLRIGDRVEFDGTMIQIEE
ncbi:MAG: RNA-binding S4 domain-containing protein [Spirosomataceae bacterium]